MPEGLIDPSPIVTHTLPMADFQTAFAMMEKGDNSIKVQLES